MQLKQILLIGTLFSFLISCDKKPVGDDDRVADTMGLTTGDQKYASMAFEETAFDFGKIKQGDTVRHTFIFKNNGENPLLISNATASCGCTVPSYPKQPVATGEKGQIDVVFNSRGKSGVQNKTVVITANTLPNTITLILKGEVETPIPTKQ